MKKDVNVFIEHILESIKKIEEFTNGISRENFLKSAQLQDAVVRRLEIIGEAVKNIPAEFRKKHAEIPWSELAKTRDKLIHGYFGIDMELTWGIVKEDLPHLKEKIKKIADADKEKEG